MLYTEKILCDVKKYNLLEHCISEKREPLDIIIIENRQQLQLWKPLNLEIHTVIVKNNII